MEWFNNRLKGINGISPSYFWLFAAAKSLQSCPTPCDHIDGSPPGFPVPVILQARTQEWVAISISNAWKWKVKVKSLGHFQLLATPWTAAYQAPSSMGFSRQEYWSGVPSPSPEEISRLPHSIVYLYSFTLITEEGFLISPCDSLELCIQMLMLFLFSFAFCFSSFHSYFVSPPQTAILLFCISFSWGCSWSLSPVQCHEPPPIVHQALCLSDLVP